MEAARGHRGQSARRPLWPRQRLLGERSNHGAGRKNEVITEETPKEVIEVIFPCVLVFQAKRTARGSPAGC